MAKSRLVRARPADPPSLLTCMAISAFLCMVVFLFVLLPFCDIDKFSPSTTRVAWMTYPGCVFAVLSWRVWRYGMPGFCFNLAHLLIAVFASGMTGAVLAQGAYAGVLRLLILLPVDDVHRGLGDGYFAAHPIALMGVVVAFAAVCVDLASRVARAGERNAWSAKAVNALVGGIGFLVLPALLLSILIVLEDVTSGVVWLIVTIGGAAIAWRVVVDVLGRNRCGIPRARVSPKTDSDGTFDRSCGRDMESKAPVERRTPQSVCRRRVRCECEERE